MSIGIVASGTASSGRMGPSKIATRGSCFLQNVLGSHGLTCFTRRARFLLEWELSSRRSGRRTAIGKVSSSATAKLRYRTVRPRPSAQTTATSAGRKTPRRATNAQTGERISRHAHSLQQTGSAKSSQTFERGAIPFSLHTGHLTIDSSQIERTAIAHARASSHVACTDWLGDHALSISRSQKLPPRASNPFVRHRELRNLHPFREMTNFLVKLALDVQCDHRES